MNELVMVDVDGPMMFEDASLRPLRNTGCLIRLRNQKNDDCSVQANSRCGEVTRQMSAKKVGNECGDGCQEAWGDFV